MVAQERLTEPRITLERLLEKPRSFSNLPVFLDINGSPPTSSNCPLFRANNEKKTTRNQKFEIYFSKFELG